MNYNLSKKLKEHGFPQKTLFGWQRNYTRKSGTLKRDSKPYLQYKGYFDIASPTLEELIEACGEDFGSLKKDAFGFTAYPSMNRLIEKKEWHLCIGETPTEAVANLWIALKSK